MNDTTLEKKKDRVILVGLSSPKLERREQADEESMKELAALEQNEGASKL